MAETAKHPQTHCSQCGQEFGAADEGYSSCADHQLNAEALPELFSSLKALLDWCREHTSPIQANSPHQLLIAAHYAIAKAKGNRS